MEKVKVGIIGTGGISNAHMGGYKAMSDTVEVVAACDIDEAKLKLFIERIIITEEKRVTFRFFNGVQIFPLDIFNQRRFHLLFGGDGHSLGDLEELLH